MKKGFKTLMYAALSISLVASISSCKKDEDKPITKTDNSNNLVEISSTETIGKWMSTTHYYTFNEGNSGEEGTISSISGDEKEGDISWEVTSFMLETLDYTTQKLVNKESRCIKVTDADGYYTELQVIRKDDIITLKDNINNISYTKEGSQGDNNGNNTGSIIDQYKAEDFARIWYNDSWMDSVYYSLNKEHGGVCLDAANERYNITWEFAIISVDQMSTAGELTTLEKPGIKIIDPEGYFVELTWEVGQECVDSVFDTSLNRWFKKIKNEYDEPEYINNVPGRIEIENYARGIEGETYHDNNNYGTDGNNYRFGGVDIAKDDALSNGHGLYNVRTGEWLKYAVNVTEPGIYGVSFNLSCTYHSSFGDGMNAYLISGTDSAKINIKNNNGTYTDYTAEGFIYLNSYSDMIILAFEGADATFTIDYMELSKDLVSTSYEWEDFYTKKYSNGANYIEFKWIENYGYLQQGNFYINGISSDFGYGSNSLFTVTTIMHNGHPDNESHVGEIIVVNKSPTGMEEEGVFEIIDENTIKYFGEMNAYYPGDNGYAQYEVEPVILTLEQ